MRWNSVFEKNTNILELVDDVYGGIGFITPVRDVNKNISWEVEFAIDDLELYINEIFVGTIDEAKLKLLDTADNYLQNKVNEFTKLQERIRSLR